MSIYGDAADESGSMSTEISSTKQSLGSWHLQSKWTALTEPQKLKVKGLGAGVAVLLFLYVVFGTSSSESPQERAMEAQMGGSNLLVNGELVGPVADEKSIPGWQSNNAIISVTDWPQPPESAPWRLPDQITGYDPETHSFPCNSEAFGGDPAFGRPKECDCEGQGKCADEHGNCVCDTRARFTEKASYETGRRNVIKVGDKSDAPGFSDLYQTVDTVIGQTYTLSFDVWVSDAERNTASQPFCSSADSNGQMIIRPETHDTSSSTFAVSFASNDVCAGAEGYAYCHGDLRLCPEASDHWLTVSGTYTATHTRTTIALHSESRRDAYFDEVYMTTAPDTCKPSVYSEADGEGDVSMCQCSHLREAQQGTGSLQAMPPSGGQDGGFGGFGRPPARAGGPQCRFHSGNTGRGTVVNVFGSTVAPQPLPGEQPPTNWMDADGVAEGDIFVDVDTTDPVTHQPRFIDPTTNAVFTPHYVASLGGQQAGHHMTTGASSIYQATPYGFRVYIKRQTCLSCTSTASQVHQPPLTAALAKEQGLHINWVAEEAPCGGAGDSTNSHQWNAGMTTTGIGQGQTIWQPYCWTQGVCNGIFADITFPPDHFTTTPVIVASLHGDTNHADARGANAIYSATKDGFRVYIHSTTGLQGGITPQDAVQWGWKIVYLASDDRRHSGHGDGMWLDVGENTIETTVCHNQGFNRGSTVHYVTSVTGSSHHWTTDGASSIYAASSDSFRIYMFREGNVNSYGQTATTGTGSGGGDALTASNAEADNWRVNFISDTN